MKKALLYLSVTSVAFLALYLFYLLCTHVIEPLLRKTGLQFDESGFSSLGNIGNFIMVLIYILSAMAIGIFMGVIFHGKIPIIFYLFGYFVLFTLFLIYTPNKYPSNAELLSWLNWIDNFFQRDSKFFAPLADTMTFFGFALVPYVVTKLTMFIISIISFLTNKYKS